MSTSARQIDWNMQPSLLSNGGEGNERQPWTDADARFFDAKSDARLMADAASPGEGAHDPFEVTIGLPDASDDLRDEAEQDVAAANAARRRAAPRRSRPMMVLAATTALGALCAGAWTAWMPPRYEAVVEFVARPDAERLSAASGVEAPSRLFDQADGHVMALTGPAVLQQVADRLNLEDDPEFTTLSSHPSEWSFAALLNMASPGGLSVPAAALRDKVNVMRAPGSFIIRTGVTTGSAEKSALIANTLAETFLKLPSGSAASAADNRLAEMEKAANEAERRAQDYAAENRLGPVLASEAEVRALQAQIADARLRTVELNATTAAARGADLESFLAGELPASVENAGLRHARADYLDASQNLARLSANLGPKHPQRIAAEGLVSDARRILDAQLRGAIGKLQIDLTRAVEIEQHLAGRMAEIKAERETAAPELVRLQDLRRDADARRSAYEAARLEAKRGPGASGLAGINLVAPAFAPVAPVELSMAKSIFGGAGAGLLGGMLVVLGLSRRRDEQVEVLPAAMKAEPVTKVETVEPTVEIASEPYAPSFAHAEPEMQLAPVEEVVAAPSDFALDASEFEPVAMSVESEQTAVPEEETVVEFLTEEADQVAGETEMEVRSDEPEISSNDAEWLALLNDMRHSVANDNPESVDLTEIAAANDGDATLDDEDHIREIEAVRQQLREFRAALFEYHARKDAEQRIAV
ncbi:hypothetical protein QBK99_21525 [Corticibacterium sp. UT-5YL-CI-8]|nr:hypothetical protein [Tianweitania sp. UT-5YL-CI-8]